MNINSTPEICHPHIVDAGFAQRGKVILEREHNLYPLMYDQLIGQRGGSSFEDAATQLTMQMLVDAFYESDILVLNPAAFLAGRCQPKTQKSQTRLVEMLRALLVSLPAQDLDIRAEVYIQTAMSLALRGQPDLARQAMLPLVSGLASTSDESYLAAFYLAQMGDPVGYPAILKALDSTGEHTRLMAMRHLIAFQPYSGQTVSGHIVDIRAQLLRCMQDPTVYVRREAAIFLAEAKVEGYIQLIQDIVRQDQDEEVVQTAGYILRSLDAGSGREG